MHGPQLSDWPGANLDTCVMSADYFTVESNETEWSCESSPNDSVSAITHTNTGAENERGLDRFWARVRTHAP